MLTSRPKLKIQADKPFLTNPQSPASLSTNIMRIKVLKSERIFTDFHCPQGFGYYMIENSGCTKYKLCENWNDEYASMSVNKCRQGVFDSNKRICVPASLFECNDKLPNFVPEV